MERKWRPGTRPQDVRVGRNFMMSDFLYSQGAVTHGVANLPLQFDGSEVQGMSGLCQHILDPVVDEFGSLSITFGYVSRKLWEFLYGTNAEQFALHLFRPPQGGIGGAADILVHSQENPRIVLNWIRDHCIYDRLIIYPGSRILCVAWTEVSPRYHCKEWVFGKDGDRNQYLDAGREEPPKPKPNRKRRYTQPPLFERRRRRRRAQQSPK